MSIYIFNSSCEMAVRHDGMSYSPPKIIEKMEDDMACIVMFLAGENDFIVGKKPDDDLLHIWFDDQERTPRFISKSEAVTLISQGEKLCPWGASRSIYSQFGQREKARQWAKREMLSRKTSVKIEQVLKTMVNAERAPLSELSRSIGFDAKSVLVTNEQELNCAVDELCDQDGSRSQNNELVVKTLWSASGRGVRFFRYQERDAAVDFGRKSITSDGGVVVEKKLKRMAELSFLFYRQADGHCFFSGVNVYHSSDNGTFGIERAGAGRLTDFDSVLPHNWQDNYGSRLATAIETVLTTDDYEGPIGVDAMLYRASDGTSKMRLCTEANLRFCMGHIAAEVAKRFSPNARVEWTVRHFAPNEWIEWKERESKTAPLKKDENGKILSGFFYLTPTGENVEFAAFGYATSSEQATKTVAERL